MKLTKQDIAKALGTGLFALLLSYGIGITYAAWNAPALNPPNGNVMAPINTGDGVQYKGGNLVLNASTSQATIGLTVFGGLWLATTSSTFNNNLRLQVDGLVGATKFCDVGGLNCFTAASSSATIATVAGMSGGSGINVQTFLVNGTWTKPAGAKSVEVYAFGAGGGGAGGKNRDTQGGLGGGGGGAYTHKTFLASVLGSTEAVTVGIGGVGGIGANGGVPTDGTDSVFGAWLKARGGKKGGATAGLGGTAWSGESEAGGTGGSEGAPGVSTDILRSPRGGAGGQGQGGGGFTTNYILAGGSAGGNAYNCNSCSASSGGPGNSVSSALFIGGTGGGGGGYVNPNSGVGSPGNGGIGGFPGGGGGAAGSCTNGNTGGSCTNGEGASGANGVITVITYF